METENHNRLSAEEQRVIIHKGTEAPFSGMYNDFFEPGSYQCRRCSTPLYRSDTKFSSSCGWPSFDDEIEGAVRKEIDADGRRVEILCTNCGAHLGHVFKGEQFTEKNVRHCVNSISLTFAPERKEPPAGKAYFAGGCFWGVEYFFERQEGVISAVSGFMGGRTENPSYHDVVYRDTGHLEVVKVTYDPDRVSYQDLAKLFFEIHDPTQANGQGPDIGEQYLSAVFVNDDDERRTAQALIDILRSKGYKVVTKVLPAGRFWKAEEYHQDYYAKNGKIPTCHAYQKRF